MNNLESASALSPGSDLWIIAEASVSKWSRKIDWHLNFQIRRAELHSAEHLAPELTQNLRDFEVDAPEIPVSPGAPLMIASFRLLPNSKTVEIRSQTDWAKKCHSVWMGLGKPLTRVFLPDAMTSDSFRQAWPQGDEASLSRIEIVS